jgi:hypothetical protein
MSLPIRQALVWLFAALIASILPVVSGQFHVPVLSTYHDFSSQVFICLNLNGQSTFLYILSTKNTDEWITILFEMLDPLDDVRSYLFYLYSRVAMGP